MPYAIKKQGNKWVVYNKDSGKVMGTHDSKEKAKAQLRALYANVKENELTNVDLNFQIGSFEIKEADPDGKWVRIGGEVFRDNVTSRNGITYTYENAKEVDGSTAKFFMTHELNPRNVVGHVKFTREGDRCLYDAKIRNTADWQDVVEKAKDRLFDVSLDARYKKIRRVKESDGRVKYHLEGMEMRGLCGVGVGGVPTNSIDYAIAEEFKKNDEKSDEKTEQIDEVKSMEEDNKLQEENLMLKKKIEEMEKAMKEKEEKEKNTIIEQIVELNKELKKEELSKKTMQELELILSYEKKLQKEEEEEGEGEEEGEAEVGDDAEEKESKAKIVIEREHDRISMNDALYKQFNEDIRKML